MIIVHCSFFTFPRFNLLSNCKICLFLFLEIALDEQLISHLFHRFVLEMTPVSISSPASEASFFTFGPTPTQHLPPRTFPPTDPRLLTCQ
ncbi:unnamed protein product [Protopolystoma xenopodis]|uniref:Uncharacterized protein n=1 Tax=Protopolystoma xenopodis TaxID=117903 RepID=A0A448WSW1_9PLAT|nr:unnamed protein product [Protopolystoma xenopodis]